MLLCTFRVQFEPSYQHLAPLACRCLARNFQRHHLEWHGCGGAAGGTTCVHTH